MVRKGFFEIEPAPGKPEGISVRIEPGADGDVWMTVNDIVKAYGMGHGILERNHANACSGALLHICGVADWGPARHLDREK